MFFNSIDFAIFLPIVFLLYWFVFNKNLRLQNLFIVIASYVFYGWWDWKFLILMGFTTLCSWISGVLILKVRGNTLVEKKKKRYSQVITATNIVLNLIILGFFKYYNFFVDAFIDAFSLFGKDLNIHTLKIVLPIGISFYTFQALSYTIDTYRKQVEPTKDVVSFFAFISFFPGLVAGPIERAKNLLPQFQKERLFDYSKAADGCRQILWGLFKKIVIADNCATYVNEIFNSYQDHTGSTLLLAAIFFAFQIYGDFSGYSDIAIGTARLFGLDLMRNFNFPYFSRDIAEFWRRWHISLTTWFRDYIYIPLGGSRVSKIKVIRNTFIIFLVSGFWHGANWTFIAWGAFHALLFMPLLLSNKNRKNTNTVAEGKILPSIKEVFQMGMTFLLIVIGWIFFRAESIGQAFDYIGHICDSSLFTLPYMRAFMERFLPMFVSIAILLIIEWIQRDKQHGLQLSPKIPMPIRYCIYLLFIFLIHRYQGGSSAFIYFQF